VSKLKSVPPPFYCRPVAGFKRIMIKKICIGLEELPMSQKEPLSGRPLSYFSSQLCRKWIDKFHRQAKVTSTYLALKKKVGPGETVAVKEVLDLKGYTLHRSPISSSASYIIVE
jgi:hypothetical protein